ncbi:MAG: hypothetical protein ACLQNE_36275 [Thermoguttaceae bacterium]
MDEMPKPRRHWFHFTPERLLIALLPVWGALFLFEHFHWLNKGYSVLFAVASMVAVLLFLLLWFVVALVFRWRFQYSIRTLLLVMLLASIGMSWVAVKMQGSRKQRGAVEAIQKLRGGAWYDYEFVRWGVPLRTVPPPGPAWLRKLLGDDVFTDVVAVTLTGTEVADDRLEALDHLTQLKWASLCYTNITDMGLKHLRGCNQLQGLILSHTRITDEGLEHLGGLTELRDVGLNGTQVTDEGIRRLQQALPRWSVNGFTVE